MVDAEELAKCFDADELRGYKPIKNFTREERRAISWALRTARVAPAARIELLENALKAIKRATINGDVCDDVAWFDQIETLHDFCERILDPVGAPK